MAAEPSPTEELPSFVPDTITPAHNGCRPPASEFYRGNDYSGTPSPLWSPERHARRDLSPGRYDRISRSIDILFGRRPGNDGEAHHQTAVPGGLGNVTGPRSLDSFDRGSRQLIAALPHARRRTCAKHALAFRDWHFPRKDGRVHCKLTRRRSPCQEGAAAGMAMHIAAVHALQDSLAVSM